MSPTKPSTSVSTRLQRHVGTVASSIPRRIKTSAAASIKSQNVEPKSKTVLKSKLKSNSSTGNKDSIFNDSTATTLPAKVTSYFAGAQYGGDNKENIPLSGVMTRSRASRVNGGSPTRGKSGISKATPSILQRSALARLPLRELSEGEIFERDEAALGDLRRRRSGEHSGSYVEFDSHTAQAVDTRASSAISSSTVTASLHSTTVTEVIEEEDGKEECGGKIRVLRRTDSEEVLRVKVEAIMAATSAASSSTGTTKKFSTLRKRMQTPTKLKHPALKDSPAFSPATTPLPFAGSSERFSLSPTKESPILSRQSAAAVTKAQQSPVRTVRKGLGTKSANTIMKEVVNAIKENPDKGKKVIISASNNPTVGQKKKTATKKPAGGLNTLRRAAGSSRPTTTAAKAGLESIRRMR